MTSFIEPVTVVHDLSVLINEELSPHEHCTVNGRFG